MKVLRFVPATRVSCDGYDLEAFAVECDADGVPEAFRFELGSGLIIYWARPIERDGRLRLIMVDSAVAEVDEPSVMRDPFAFDLPATTWTSDEATVVVEVTAQPPMYRCEITPRGGAPIRFEWRGGP